MSQAFQAVSVGSKVPVDPFRARVHSVFHTSANLTVDGLAYLLTLFVSMNTDLPQGIRLPKGAERFLAGLQPGQMMHCQADSLQADTSGVVVDLKGARRYTSHVARLNAEQFSGQARTAWQQVLHLLTERQAEKEAGLRVVEISQASAPFLPAGSERNPTAQRARNLILAARRFDGEAAAQAVGSLVGLGGGLTPTGDDLLVGFLAGIRATAGQDPRRLAWVHHLAELVRTASQATNDISRSYLILAAEDQFSSSLSQLAAAVCNGAQPEQVHAASEVVFQTGHTSGLDAAAGLLAGFGAWQENLLSLE